MTMQQVHQVAEIRGYDIVIRDGESEDLQRVCEIYTYYVTKSLATFEETAPDVEEMRQRFEALKNQDLPFFVAEINGEVQGYAYAGRYRARSAYRYTVEDSIYVSPESLNLGIGRRLLNELIDACAAKGYKKMIAVIGDSENAASINLHARAGFVQAGVLEKVGHKFGRWVDTVIMQRDL